MEPADQPVPPASKIPRDFNLKDVGYRIVKAACSAAPWPLSTWLEQVLGLVYVDPLARRQLDFLDSSFQRIEDQQRKGVCRDWQALAADPSFSTTIVQATRIAQAQHQREMLEALRNVLVNTAAGQPELDDDARAILLHLLERFTPSHLVLLRFLDDTRRVVPSGGINPHTTIAQLLNAVHPEFRSRPDLRHLVTRQLYEMHLINVEELTRAAESSHTLPLGKRLLALVADPSTWPQ